MTLIAYQHITRSKATHLRVRQSLYSEAMKHRLQRVGSPARWVPEKWEWDWPLTPAAVVALATAARETGETIEWNDGLKEFAEQHLKQSDAEHEVRLAIERIIRDKPLLPEYVTRRTKVDGSAIEPLYHQQVSYHWSQRVGGLLLAHDPGCVSGKAIIKVNRHGAVRPITVEELYRKFNDLPHAHPWKVRGETTTKSLMPDGTLRHNVVEQVLDRGVRSVVRVRLASGKELVCTPDHEVGIPGGWARADQLVSGSTVYTNGTPVCSIPGCGSTRNIITYRYATYRGLCKSCAYRRWRKPGSKWKAGRTLDKSGYVIISGQWAHPYCDHHGSMREHRLVMEKKLGRYLLPTEVVHHLNEVKNDNRIENLELLPVVAHARGHGEERSYANMDGGRGGTGGEIIFYPRQDTVVSVTPAGEERVFDLVMADPGRSFVVNGVLVHNCGKTRAAADASGGWYRNGLIRPMTPAVNEGAWGVEGGVLVVCPKIVLKTWQNELLTWQNASSVIIRGDSIRKKRLAATPSHYHLINYESLKHVEHNRYDALILDEIHRCANNTGQTNRALTIAGRARKKLGLTGTPVANSLESVFYPLLILDGGKSLGASKTAFLEKFFHLENRGPHSKNIPNEGAAQAIAHAMAESTYFVSKAEVLPWLPKKTHTPLYLEMSPDQERYYNELKNEAVAYIQDAEVTVSQASARMMKLLQVCQGFVLADNGEGRHFNNAKTDALFDLLTDTLAGRKVIVWCYFKYEIAQVVAGLKARGIKAVHVDGSVTSQRQRDADVDAWNHDPTVTVSVRQLDMSEGVTLIANESGVPCYDNIYCGMSYRYVAWKQSQDRIHRLGQEYPCSYTYLLTETGLDKAVYESVLEKGYTADFVAVESKDYYLKLLRAA